MLTEMYSRLYDNSFLTREFAFFPKFEGVYLDDPKEIKFEFYRRPWNSFQRGRIQHGSHEFFEEFAENHGPQNFEDFESVDDQSFIKRVSLIAENITEKISSKTKLLNKESDVFAEITEKVDFVANLIAMKNQKLLEILVRWTYAVQLILFSILSFFFCPFKTILKKLSASLKAISAIGVGGKINQKLQKKPPTKIRKDSTIKVQPEPEKESSSLEEPQNRDFWWDTVSLDLSFQPKSAMIDSGIFEPELEVQLQEENTVLEQKGSDVTVLTSSETIDLAGKAADVILERHKLECDVISLGKMDSSAMEMILTSLRKTGHLVIIENEWSNTGEEVFMAIRECEGYRKVLEYQEKYGLLSSFRTFKSFYSERKTGYGRIIKVKM